MGARQAIPSRVSRVRSCFGNVNNNRRSVALHGPFRRLPRQFLAARCRMGLRLDADLPHSTAMPACVTQIPTALDPPDVSFSPAVPFCEGCAQLKRTDCLAGTDSVFKRCRVNCPSALAAIRCDAVNPNPTGQPTRSPGPTTSPTAAPSNTPTPAPSTDQMPTTGPARLSEAPTASAPLPLPKTRGPVANCSGRLLRPSLLGLIAAWLSYSR